MGAGTGGRLATRRWVSPGGRTPRFFASGPTGRFLYAATGHSDDSLRFAVAGGTGKPTLAGEADETGSPACIVFRDAAWPFR